MSDINTTGNENLFSRPKHNPESLTQEEVQDIMRFADAYGISGAAEASLLLFLRNRKKAAYKARKGF